MAKNTILKAGAIVRNNAKNEIALLYRAKQNDWSFPKGHTEPGESSASTMAREIEEEIGLQVQILRELPDLNYIHPNGNAISTKMFLAQSKGDSVKPELEGDDVKWMPIGKVISVLSHDNLKEYFKAVLPLIGTE
jgi:8-oxo-dGTP diphosphatase